MELVPHLYVKNRKIYGTRNGFMLVVKEVVDQVPTNEKIYIEDIDGIEKNEPNLELYQVLSETHEIWIDAGPRTVGDVVDIVMTGANAITIRPQFFLEKDIPTIQEITESDIYLGFSIHRGEAYHINNQIPSDIKGIVFVSDEPLENIGFEYWDILKTIGDQCGIYVTMSDEHSLNYWKNLGVIGILVDIAHIAEMRQRGL